MLVCSEMYMHILILLESKTNIKNTFICTKKTRIKLTYQVNQVNYSNTLQHATQIIFIKYTNQ